LGLSRAPQPVAVEREDAAKGRTQLTAAVIDISSAYLVVGR